MQQNKFKKRFNLTHLIGITILSFGLLSTVHATNSFPCPQPNQIATLQLPLSPFPDMQIALWFAPPIGSSKPNEIGFGIGGAKVGRFIGASQAIVNNRDGWACFYESTNHARFSDVITQLPKHVQSLSPYLVNQGNGIGMVAYELNY